MMREPYSLADLLEESRRRHPEKIAVAVPEGTSISYEDLGALSDSLRDRLWHMGVRPGDRVGLRLHKSVDAVATIFGILKTGAAYVPVDAESPAARGAYILNDCQVKAVITEGRLEKDLANELHRLGASPAMMVLGEGPADLPLRSLLNRLQQTEPAPVVATQKTERTGIAYVLYTSGSTGNPKGVVLSHENAASFIDWCSETFHPTQCDTFSSHAPFHFDLSILDIFVAMKHGSRLVLFGESLGKDPMSLASSIASEGISIWYSTPSILSLLSHYGKLDRYDYSSLRMVLFAGEVFPVPQFRILYEALSGPRYYNLYGPTETNVCTYYEVLSDSSWEGMDSFPVGRICKPNSGRVVDEKGEPVALGEPGELIVAGPNVMKGYWNLPEQNERAFIVGEDGIRWYRTGDIVTEGRDGEYRYVGRRDRMVKRRGYRVELGEIEAALMRHQDIREAAVVSVPDPESGGRIAAFISCKAGRSKTIIDLKKISTQSLPPYMIPDVFKVIDALPRTSTNKVDFQTLKSMV